MNKVICDVCGTDYPEAEPRCPICDCVRTDGGQTSAGNTEEGTYTYVRGGRFSKSNVKKRLKAKQLQEEDLMQKKVSALDEVENSDDSEDEQFDEEELEAVSNRGLIIVMILLLVAIIAVGSYLVVEVFKKPDDRDYTKSTTSSTTTKPTDDGDSDVVEKPCTGVMAPEEAVSLTEVGQTLNLMDSIDVLPADTTDKVEFASGDETVATVDDKGVVTAVGAGQTMIYIRCGEVEVEMEIICAFETENPGEDEPGTDEPGTDDPGTDEPVVVIKLKLRYSDVTLDGVFPSLQLYKGDINVADITWTSSKESVATVKDGLVTAVSLGSTKITAEYQGQTVTCMVHVSQAALDKLGIGQGTDTPEQPDQPDEPDQPQTQTYSMKLNGKDPKWNLGRPNTAEANLLLNGSKYENRCTLTIVDADGNVMDVTWSISDTSVLEYDAASGKFVAKALGNVTLKATYEGVEYEALLHIV